MGSPALLPAVGTGSTGAGVWWWPNRAMAASAARAARAGAMSPSAAGCAPLRASRAIRSTSASRNNSFVQLGQLQGGLGHGMQHGRGPFAAHSRLRRSTPYQLRLAPPDVSAVPPPPALRSRARPGSSASKRAAYGPCWSRSVNAGSRVGREGREDAPVRRCAPPTRLPLPAQRLPRRSRWPAAPIPSPARIDDRWCQTFARRALQDTTRSCEGSDGCVAARPGAYLPSSLRRNPQQFGSPATACGPDRSDRPDHAPRGHVARVTAMPGRFV
jgi:hypothetical protein